MSKIYKNKAKIILNYVFLLPLLLNCSNLKSEFEDSFALKYNFNNYPTKQFGSNRININALFGSEEYLPDCHLYEYYENDPSYYLIYLKGSLISKYKRNFKENNDVSEQFSDINNEKIVDGKYLFQHQIENNENLLNGVYFLKVDSFNDIQFKINNYKLIFCYQKKNIKAIKDVTKNIDESKNITLYTRINLDFNGNELKRYQLSNTILQSYLDLFDYRFNFEGEVLDINFSDNESQSFRIYNTLNDYFVTQYISSYEGKKTVLLPRYWLSGNKYIDILVERDYTEIGEIFYNYYPKEEFKNALVSDVKYDEGNKDEYRYAHFDYEKIKTIVQNNYNSYTS